MHNPEQNKTEPDHDLGEGVLPPRRRPGIYLLPNLFTTAGLFAGFYGIVAAIGGRYEAAAIAIFVAMIMDGMDGRIARMTNTQSDFGKEYDSLVDMVAFGLAPALIVYEWALQPLGKIGWLAAFIYAAATALRLARFNTQASNKVDKRYFQGLASPAAACLIAGLVWIVDDSGMAGEDFTYIAALLTVAAGVLMVSNVRYHSFKDIDFKGKIRFVVVLFIVLGFVLISIAPPQVLFLMALFYAGSGPVLTLLALRKNRSARDTADTDKVE